MNSIINYAMPKEAESYLKEFEPDTIIIMAIRDGMMLGFHSKYIKDSAYYTYTSWSENNSVLTVKTVRREQS